MTRLVRFAWATLALNVGVILLGALVRATGSGAGCGRSWPTCDGRLLPPLEGARAVEYTHRVAGGVALAAVVVLAVWVFRSLPRGHPARLGAVLSVLAIVAEALIGAWLVLGEMVGSDDSVARTVSVPLHLVNTLLLLAALTLTAHWVSGGGELRPSRDPGLAWWLLAAGVGMVVVAATGAVTALADTLFPKDTVGLTGGTGAEHFLTRLRLVHPVVAVVLGIFVALLARWRGLDREHTRAAARAVIVIVAIQFVSGVVNVLLLTPVWSQLLHLLLADVLWVALVLFAARALQAPAAEPVAGLSPARTATPPGR